MMVILDHTNYKDAQESSGRRFMKSIDGNNKGMSHYFLQT